jgi:hypothetical protein
MSGYPEQKLGLRTPLQLSAGERTAFLRMSGYQGHRLMHVMLLQLSGKLWARADPQDKLFQLPVVRRIIM